MKIIIYTAIILSATINACNQTNKTENKTEINVSGSAIDTVKQQTKPIEKTDTETKQKEKNTEVEENKKEFFKLLNATSESWTAGVANGGSGIEYYFKIKITTSDNIKFDTAWINKKAFEIYISKETNSVSSQPIKYGNGDTITVRVSDLKNQNSKSVNVNPPKKYDGAALVGFTVNGKRNYFNIKEIKKQTSPNRQ
jgi:hypothetical protein